MLGQLFFDGNISAIKLNRFVEKEILNFKNWVGCYEKGDFSYFACNL